MHGHHALHRQQIIEDAENRLLHFTRICSATDQNELFGEVHSNDSLAAATMTRRVCAEAWQIDNGVFRHKAGQLFLRRAHQQGADEQIVPCKFVNHTHIDAVLWLRTTEQVSDVQFVFATKRGNEIFFQRSKMGRVHSDVGFTPPNAVFGFGVAHNKLVFGRAPRVCPRLDNERTVFRQNAFIIRQRGFDQRRCAEIAMQLRLCVKTLLRKRDI